MERRSAENLLNFIRKSPSCYHVIDNVGKMLETSGFIHIYEEDFWRLESGGKYYVTRGESSLIAFTMPKEEITGFQIIASHSDSPTFKLKENGEIEIDKAYVKLNVEKYGGMIMSTWMDRPLSLAGRIMIETEKRIESRLINLNRDLLIIPSLAIHMNRNINDGYSFNVKKDLLPLFAQAGETTLTDLIAEEANIKKTQLAGMDLFLYNRMPGSIWGAEDSFLSSPRLDNLQCAYCSLAGFLAGTGSEGRSMVYCILDNEEVGSRTRQGAGSTFMQDVLTRVILSSGRNFEEYYRAISGSFLISADNAHSVHPNYPEMSDEKNRPYMNHGPVIKYSANQKYTTESSTAAVFAAICKKADVPVQRFYNRSDMEGGSTLGNISSGFVPVPAVDIGLPQLAMHSSYETAGVKDTNYLVRVTQEYFSSTVRSKRDGNFYEVDNKKIHS